MYHRTRFQGPRHQQQGRSHNGQSRRRGQPKQLDPRLFVQKAEEQAEEVYTPQHSFADFPVDSQLHRNIQARGFVTPTPIQDQTIPALLAGRDIIGIASTGTGKTAAFLIPLIHKVLKDQSQKVLIVAPTRELAVQIQDEFREFARNMNLLSVLCIGGVGMFGQIQSLQRRHQFVIGTPGRLRDLEKQRKLSFTSFNNIVLDEVDRMLDMGFVHEVSYIVSHLSSPRQSFFFSATLPPDMKPLMHSFLKDPVTVTVKGSKPSTNVDQNIVRMQGQQKIDVLLDLLQQHGFDKVLVFGRTKWGMEKLAKALDRKGVSVAAIHGNKNQNQRQKAIDMFKSNRIHVLLATDIASRGLDIDNVTHVINYDPPQSYEDYIHRIGRTGRAGKKGTALTFIE
jgi:ATP-dependent RNA helicase RhlE